MSSTNDGQRVLYVRDAADNWVYYADVNGTAAARQWASDLAAAGKAVRVCDGYLGPVIIR